MDRFPPNVVTKREEETFEDYTSVTVWEKFTQSLENLLNQWELRADGDPQVREALLSTVTWTLSGYICGRLLFGKREFTLTYYGHHLMKKSNDPSYERFSVNGSETFTGNVMPSLTWFGLKHMLLLRPTEGRVTNASSLHVLLSSVEMAMHAVRCPIPILVEYNGPSSSYFYGVGTTGPLPESHESTTVASLLESAVLVGALNVEFSVGQMKGNLNPVCTHLAGLQETFLSKLGVTGRLPVTDVAARLIYRIPCWSESVEFSDSDLPVFSFDLTATSLVSPLFHLACVWPTVPSHAITQYPSSSILKPEGAPEWYMQLFVGAHGDRLCLRLKHLVRSIRSATPLSGPLSPPVLDNRSTFVFHPITSRLAWLGADLQRLDSILNKDHSPLSVPSNTSVELTGKQVLHYLLFLLPDADPEYVASSAMAREFQVSSLSLFPGQHLEGHDDLTQWQHIQDRSSLTITELSHMLNLPSPTSLVHRLAILLSNLHFLQPRPPSSDLPSLLQIMFNELLVEFKLRLNGLISLPSHRVYVASEQHINPSSQSKETYSSDVKHVDTTETPFQQWADTERCNLSLVFERFSMCITTAHHASLTKSTDLDTVEHGDSEGVEDDFFDAVEESSGNRSGEAPREAPETAALVEAQSILTWLQSLDHMKILRLLLPSICLEALISFHSTIVHPRLTSWYRKSLDNLTSNIQSVLSRLKQPFVELDGYTTPFERSTAVYCEILFLLATFSSRLTVLRELIHTLQTRSDSDISDKSLSLLCDLSSEAVCGQVAWTACCSGWVRIDRSSKEFISLHPLFGSQDPTSNTYRSFEFSSVKSRNSPAFTNTNLDQPIWESYLFECSLPQPNPLTSRQGRQRLYADLGRTDLLSPHHNPDILLLAGRFSQDTQFS